MKILFITSYLPGRGLHGGSSRIFEILRFLKEKGHFIYLVSFHQREKTKIYEKRIEELVDGLKIFDKTPMLGKPYNDVLEFLKELFTKESFDLVQFEYIHTGDYLNSIPQNIPTILTEHELNFQALKKRIELESLIFNKALYFLKSQIVKKRELRIMKKVDKIICVNEMDSKVLSTYIQPEKIEIIPHGVDVEFFSPNSEIEPEKDTIGFFGYYKHYPNVDAVLYFSREIFPKIKREHPSLKFLIIGRNPPKEVRNLEKIKGITVTGYVDDLKSHLQRCEVIVSPIRLGMGMRVKILEAMSMGKPIVATSLSCEGFKAVDGVHLIKANEPQTFAESVSYLLENPEMAKKLGSNARKLAVSEYNYKKIGNILENLYKIVLEEKSIAKN